MLDKTFNIKIETKNIHPDYSVLPQKQYTITDTGWMKVFEILPKAGNGLKFIGRCDFKKTEDLDVDIHNIDKETKKEFLKESEGYIGHHSVNINPKNRTYKVYVKIKEVLFFEGEIFFNINRTVKFTQDNIKII